MDQYVLSGYPGSIVRTDYGTVEKDQYFGYAASEKTPDYYRRRARGEYIPQTHYLRYDLQHTMVPYYNATISSDSYRHENRDFKFWAGTYLPSTEESVREVANAVVQGLDLNVIAMQQEAYADMLPQLDALTSLVELKETADMFINARKRAKELVDQVRPFHIGRSGFRSLVQAADALGDARMEWRYGWKLLLLDIEAAVDAYNFPIRGAIINGKSSTVETILEDGDQVSAPHSSFPTQWGINSEWSDTTRSSAYVTAGGSLALVTKNYLMSPSTTLWESAKLSFVADWFVSVGDALGAWEVIRKMSYHDSALNLYSRRARVERINGVYPISPTTITSLNMAGSLLQVSELKQRSPLGAPSFVPQLRLRLNTERIADAITILKSRI